MEDKILRRWARSAATHPWLVLAVITVAALLSIYSAFLSPWKIRMEMDWSDLLPMKDPTAQEFDRILQEYTSVSTIHIVVRGEEAQIKEFAEKIAPEIEALTEYVERVDYKMDSEFFSEHGFMLAKATDLERMVPMFEDLSLVPLLTYMNDNFEAEYIEEEEALSTKEKEDNAVRSLDGLHFWLRTMDEYVSRGKAADAALAEESVDRLLYGDPYFISQDKRVLLLAIKPTFTAMDITKDIESTEEIQGILAGVLPEFPNVRAGVTGIIPLQKDEMEHTTKDMKWGSMMALVAVLTLFILTFRMWAAPFLAGLTLAMSIAIAAGVSGLTVGRLNLMTSMFAVVLIGLGIDYAIHLISVYNERRVVDEDAATAMEETLVRSGSGIITGSLTTAAAFFTLAVSVTRGIKEMGIVLGIGIVCAMVVTMAGLPAMLVVRERFVSKVRQKPFKPRNVEFKVLERFGESTLRHPLVYLLLAVAITSFLLYQALHVRFDYNMYNLEPEGLETVALQDTIIEAFDMSPDFAMVTASSLEESWEMAERAKAMPSFGMVEHIGDLCPPRVRQLETLPYVEEIRKNLESGSMAADIGTWNVDRLIEELERLDMNIYELSQLAFIGGQDKVDEKCVSIIGDPEDEDSQGFILALAEKISQDPSRALVGLNLFQERYFPEFREKALKMANPEIITLENLPQYIKERYINDSGDTYLVTIYPREQVWELDALRRFAGQLERVSPKVTGNTPIFLKLIGYIARDGLWATALTVLIVVILLWIDFRSLKMALLAILPLVAGGVWMIGLLKSFGMMLNFVNVMGLPMIVGIGIDDGVHLLHRYRYEGFDKSPVVLGSTGKAILLTSLTTMAGFGSLTLGSYRGWVSLGALLSIGVGACFLTTILFLPAIITLIRRYWGQRPYSS